jgi:hypothetical protein
MSREQLAMETALLRIAAYPRTRDEEMNIGGAREIARAALAYCSHCGFQLPASDSGLRHYGTHTAHQESECLRLLHAEIERLTKPASADEVRDLLRAKLVGRTHAALAADLGVTQGYLSKVLAGDCNPGEKLLRQLGLRKVVRYEPANAGDKGPRSGPA